MNSKTSCSHGLAHIPMAGTNSSIPGSEPPTSYERDAAQTQRHGGTYLNYRPDGVPTIGSTLEPSNDGPMISNPTRRYSVATGFSDDTAVASKPPSMPSTPPAHPTEEVEKPSPQTSHHGSSEYSPTAAGFAPVRSEAETSKPDPRQRPPLGSTPSNRQITEEDIIRHLSRRNTGARSTSDAGQLSRASTTKEEADEQDEIDRIMSRMFGGTRQAQSEEEKTRHKGVVFKNLTVTGMGLGAALQPTFGDVFLGLPRLVRDLIKKGPKGASGKPPVKTILNDLSGCVKPGEMCLVLGRPGSGCSSFLKVLGNQRFGYESVDGEIMYGGTDAKTMYKKYRGEVVYNPEDDVHFATLSVKNTLSFALKCKTPGKEGRLDGESAKSYVESFLRSVVKLFWIEHTLGTKVGNEFVSSSSVRGEWNDVLTATGTRCQWWREEACLHRRGHDHEGFYPGLGQLDSRFGCQYCSGVR